MGKSLLSLALLSALSLPTLSFAEEAIQAAELAYLGAEDNGYWNAEGLGGSSFNGRTQTADLTDDRLIFTVSRSF